MSHSLILPKRVGEARQRQKAAAAVMAPGRMHNSDDWFEDWKLDIRAQMGWALDKFDMQLNRVLVAIFKRPEEMALAGGGTLTIPEAVLREDDHQGVAGLVLKLGPRCFEDSDVMTWTDADRCKPNDWVLLRRSEGFRVSINGVLCILFNDERGIKAVVPRPDVIY